jgi:hypothetical protein
MQKSGFWKRFLDYIGITWFLHVYMWAVLTPWFFLALNFTWEQYLAWVWQAPIYALLTNYPMGILVTKFVPWYRRKIGYKQ